MRKFKILSMVLILSFIFIQSSFGSWITGGGGGGVPPSIIRSARNADTILGTADRGTLIDATANTWIQTFTAAATLGNGWYVYYRNSGTGDITFDPNGAELIDGIGAFDMYPGEKRLIVCDGVGFYTILLAGGSRVFISTGTFVAPPGVSGYRVEVIGAGGGGGSGERNAANIYRNAGSGGGGGARTFIFITPIIAGTNVAVTIGVGGTGGAAVADDNGLGNDGVGGGSSSFGAYITAYGGGSGGGGEGGEAGGGGGGSGSAGATGSRTLVSVEGGNPRSSSNAFGIPVSGYAGNVGGGGGASTKAVSGSAEWGGGSGGGVDTTGVSGTRGGLSIFGGPGGGGGGSISDLNNHFAGGAGGTQGYTVLGNTVGGGGAVGGGNGAAGSNSPTGCGTGGAGGGGNAAGVGGTGGAGGEPGGGGGGGGASLNGSNSGAGGNGGRGEVRIYWF